MRKYEYKPDMQRIVETSPLTRQSVSLAAGINGPKFQNTLPYTPP
jgi:hypothetical protein